MATEIAAVIAQVVRLVRAEERIPVLRTRAQRLVRANLALMRQVRPEGVAQWSVNDLRTTVDAEYAALLMNGVEGDGAASFVHSGLARGRAAAVAASRPEARGLLGAAMLTRRPMRLADLRDHPTHSALPDGHPEMTSFVSAPVIRQGEVIGLLFATNKRGAAEFSPDDEAFVAQMATELGRSRLLGAEPAPADVMERLVVASRALRHQMDTTRSFLGSLSHELRGAISGILISAELLTDPSLGTLGEEQVRVLAIRIHSVAGNLLTLVDNLLDLGQLEAGRLDIQLQPVDLPAVLHDVEDVVKPLAERAGVSLEWPRLARVPRVVADPVRLRQVLVNLMTNAVKFTPAGGRAWLEITPDTETVSLAVCDTGRGVLEEERERIFEPFARSAQAGIDHVPGVGLGLAICRRITELHGSRLELVSEPGLGSRFSFSLRRSREPLPPRLLRPPGGEIEVKGRDGAPLSVLLVEDDPVNRQSMSDVLTAAGYQVRAVATRSAALESAGKHAPDLVILDVQL
ncbi:MAG: ATP-binding protein, partial [Candidatus Dormiibacterota bacterium]